MKHEDFAMLIASAVIIFNLSSCKKELASQPSLPPPPPHPFEVSLVADSWIKYNSTTPCDPRQTYHGECPSAYRADYAVYVAHLPSALGAANLNCNCTIRVYLVRGS